MLPVVPDEESSNRTLSRRSWFGVASVTAVAATLAACGSAPKSAPATTVTVPASPEVTTETPRPEITDPDQALDRLVQGNRRFVDGRMQHPDQDPGHRLRVSQGQEPFAVILTCADSRLPPEVLFDQGLGDLFVIRVAGNIVDAAVLGSVEYAVGHLDTPLVMVIGHERCGAVEATLESIQHHSTPHGSVAALVTAITPAVAIAEQRPGDLLDNTVRANAQMSRDAIAASPELTGPLRGGELKVLAAYYGLDDGTVSLILNQKTFQPPAGVNWAVAGGRLGGGARPGFSAVSQRPVLSVAADR
jgi:carbonic anhydrase